MAGKKKKPVRKADPSMYSTSSQPKAVKVTERGEEAMRDLVRGKEKDAAVDVNPAAAGATATARNVRMLQRVVGRLLLDGFTTAQIDAAVKDVAAEAVGSSAGAAWLVSEQPLEAALLDRLCLDVRPLPPVFAQTHVTDDVAHPLSFVPQEGQQQSQHVDPEAEAVATARAAEERAAQEALLAKQREEQAAKRRAKDEEERAAAVAYIQRREAERAAAAAAAAEDSDFSFTDSDDSEELRMLQTRNMGGTAYGQTHGGGKNKKGKKGGGGGGAASAPPATAEAAAAKLPPIVQLKKALRRVDDEDTEEQQRLLAVALVQVRREAGKAKASGDKQQQQACGKGIAYLNDLCVEYGMNQKELARMANDVKVDDDDEEKGEEDSALAAGSPSHRTAAAAAPAVDAAAPAAAPDTAGNDDDENEAWAPAEGCDLFEDTAGGGGGGAGADVSAEDSNDVQTKLPEASATAVADLLRQLGLKEKDRGVEQAPRSVLQRYCNAVNGSKPVFAVHATEPLGAEGGKPGHRYSATLRLKNVGRSGGNTAAEVVVDDSPAWYTATSEGHDAAAVCALHHTARDLPFYALFSAVWVERWRSCFIAAQLEAKNVDIATALAGQLAAAAAGAPADTNAATGCRDRGVGDADADDGEAPPEPLPPGARRPAPADSPPSQREAAVSAALKTEAKTMPQRVPQSIQDVRAGLPAAQLREPLRAALAEHDFVVVAGDTGCGKTTQVPQYLLDAAVDDGAGGAAFVVCTQPRRVAAMSVAKRVAEERGEAPPGDGKTQHRQQGTPSRVGYHVRFGAGYTKDTRLLFCTVGILLRRMTGDPLLADISHVVVDEVHERSLDGDFALAQLKALSLRRRREGLRPLKLIAMSATVDPGLFSRYLNGCPILTVEGRTFPVNRTFLEDVYEMTGYELDPQSKAAYQANSNIDDIDADNWEVNPRNPKFKKARYQDYGVGTQRNLAMVNEEVLDHELVAATVEHIDRASPPGAILVFVPGYADIQILTDMLMAVKHDVARTRKVVPLHSSVSWDIQQTAFATPPEGIRKIVIATNIAETSITVNDVVYVVDTGKAKSLTHNHETNIAALTETWISKAAAKQRMGRAGRVQEGHCYCLYTRDRHGSFDAFELPEILRASLTEICLQAKVICPARHPLQVLTAVIEPPQETRVVTAVQELLDTGVLAAPHVEKDAPRGAVAPAADRKLKLDLTVLGRHLARLPVDIRIGKLLLMGVLLGAAPPCLTIAAALSGKSPFLAGDGQKAVKAKFDRNTCSDHLVLAEAYDGWARAKTQKGGAQHKYCGEHRLDNQVMETIHDTRQQLLQCLVDADVLPAAAAAKKFNAKTTDGRGEPAPAHWWSLHSGKPAVVKAALCFAFQPNVAVMKAKLPTHTVWSYAGRDVYLQHASVNAGGGRVHPHPYVVFHNILSTKQAYISDSSVVAPAALMLFASQMVVQHRARAFLVNDWLSVDAAAQVTVIAAGLRKLIHSMMEQRLGGVSDDDKTSDADALLEPVVQFLQQNN